MFCASNKSLAIYISLMMFLTVSVASGNANLKERKASVFKLYDVSYGDRNYSNGQDFFIVGDRLYIILWKLIDSYAENWKSVIASTQLGKNTWSAVHIPGKSFFLGSVCNNEICTILHEKEEKWKLQFYDLKGNLLRTVENTYQKQKRELHRFIPIPITFPDGSLILHSMYRYESRNPIIVILLGMMSGGHGRIPKIGSCTEVVPELIISNSSFIYAEIIDSLSRSTVFAVDEKDFNASGLYQAISTTVGKYRITRYGLTDKDSNFYKQDNKIIRVSNDDLPGIYDMKTMKKLAPLPSLPGRISFGDIRYSDVLLDSQNNIYFLSRYASGLLYLFFFDQEKGVWKTNVINSDVIANGLRMYLWGEYLYIALHCFDDAFTAIKCNIADIKEGVIINLLQEPYM